MKLTNAIKKLKKSGFMIEEKGVFVFSQKNDQEISFFKNGRDEDPQITCIRVKRINDVDDSMTDYCAGVFCNNLSQAIRLVA